jgi:hypothetical protein
MANSDQNPDHLEQFVDHLVRGQPLRRAPPDLEARVLARLQSSMQSRVQPDQHARGERDAQGLWHAQNRRHGTLPWWRKGFVHWPVAARVIFLAASSGLVRFVMTEGTTVSSAVRSGEFAEPLSPAVTWVHAGASVISATASMGASVVHVVPAYWLYGAAALGIALYGALFGLGAVAYRTLYISK